MLVKTKQLLRQGIEYALDDYCRLAKRPLGIDVKPKEDQLKCGLYRAIAEAGHLVHVEGGYSGTKDKCDLMVAIGGASKPVGLELKTAWAAIGWNNKPPEQAATWAKDCERLLSLADRGFGGGFFVLLFAYAVGTDAEKSLRAKIVDLGKPALRTEPRAIALWNGLDSLECLVWRVF